MIVSHTAASYSHNNSDSDSLAQEAIRAREDSLEDLNEYVTLSNAVAGHDCYTVSHLKAGCRYQYRVRGRVRGEDWPDWDLSVQSEIIAMPATPPDAPLAVRPQINSQAAAENHNSELSTSAAKKNNSNDMETVTSSLERQGSNNFNNNSNSENVTQETFVSSQCSSFVPPDRSINVNEDFEIMHNSITITWTNGDSNGDSIEEYEVSSTRVRTYNHSDVLHARDAFLGLGQDFAGDHFNTYMLPKYQSSLELLGDSVLAETFHQQPLVWENITTKGQFLSPQVFRAVDLFPGNAYAFRVRQRNGRGWSQWSRASALISTYPSVPPDRPSVLSIAGTYLVLAWREVAYSETSLTTLEYQLQLRSLLVSVPGMPDEQNSADQWSYSSDWLLVESRQLNKPELCRHIQRTATLSLDAENEDFTGAMVQGLEEFKWYIGRVRVRTVIGWSPWSEASLPCRTFR
jgi:hypothetical protein